MKPHFGRFIVVLIVAGALSGLLSWCVGAFLGDAALLISVPLSLFVGVGAVHLTEGWWMEC